MLLTLIGLVASIALSATVVPLAAPASAAPAPTATTASVTTAATSALGTGTVGAWGGNYYGELGDGNVTITRDGPVYGGAGGSAGVFGATGSLQGGWINQCAEPTSDQIDDYVNGSALTVGGYLPIGGGFGIAGGETWGHELRTNDSDFSTTFGPGVGFGRTVEVNESYIFKLPFKQEGWR